MDTLAWALKNQGTRIGRMQVKVLYHTLRTVVPKGILMSRITCGDLVQGLYRLYQPDVIVVLDGLLDAALRAEEISRLYPETTFWLAGNAVEQERFLSRFQPKKLVRFDLSSNTRDQAQKVIAMAVRKGIGVIGFIDYEFHVVRTTLTLVGAALSAKATTKFVPYAYIDCNR